MSLLKRRFVLIACFMGKPLGSLQVKARRERPDQGDLLVVEFSVNHNFDVPDNTIASLVALQESDATRCEHSLAHWRGSGKKFGGLYVQITRS